MAMIFAVFLTNPAPICVLDEVDAPLDDANVERFCNLLDEMIRLTDTRSVIITHNPITMARMNRLFGVTMAERGVSQLVSVDLETAEKLREAGGRRPFVRRKVPPFVAPNLRLSTKFRCRSLVAFAQNTRNLNSSPRNPRRREYVTFRVLSGMKRPRGCRKER